MSIKNFNRFMDVANLFMLSGLALVAAGGVYKILLNILGG